MKQSKSISLIKVGGLEVETPIWKLDFSSILMVRSYDEHLRSCRCEREDFPASLIWKAKATLKMAFFSWKVA